MCVHIGVSMCVHAYVCGKHIYVGPFGGQVSILGNFERGSVTDPRHHKLS